MTIQYPNNFLKVCFFFYFFLIYSFLFILFFNLFRWNILFSKNFIITKLHLNFCLMLNIKKFICIFKLKSQINEYNFNSEIFNNLKLNENGIKNFIFLSIQKFRILFLEENSFNCN